MNWVTGPNLFPRQNRSQWINSWINALPCIDGLLTETMDARVGHNSIAVAVQNASVGVATNWDLVLIVPIFSMDSQIFKVCSHICKTSTYAQLIKYSRHIDKGDHLSVNTTNMLPASKHKISSCSFENLFNADVWKEVKLCTPAHYRTPANVASWPQMAGLWLWPT